MATVEQEQAAAFEDELAATPLWPLPILYLVSAVVPPLVTAALPEATLAASSLGRIALNGCLAWWLWSATPREGHSVTELIGGPMPGRAWGLVVATFVSHLAVATAIGMGLVLWVTQTGALETLAVEPAQLGVSSFVERLVLVVAVAPIVEELVFRGVLFRKWRRTRGAVHGLVYSSGAFALAHPNILPQTLLFGALMVLLYTRTRTLWAPIAAHALNNALAFGVEVFQGAMDPQTALQELRSYAWLAPVLLIAGVPWLVAFARSGWKTLQEPLPPLQRLPAGAPRQGPV